jgi:hypothetical protein
MAINNKIDMDAKYTVETTVFKVMDGCDAKWTLETPKGECKGPAFFASTTLGLDYATADLNSSNSLKVNFNTDDNADHAFSPDGMPKFSTLTAFKAGDDLTVGFNIKGLDFQTMAAPGLKVGTTHNCGGMQLTAFVNGSYNGAFEPGQISTSLFQQVNGNTSISSEMSYGRSCDDKKDDVVKTTETNAFALKLGSSHKISDSATLKAKFTLEKGGAGTDVAWVQKLGGNSSLTFAQKFGSTWSDPKFSMCYTLDA